MQPEEFLLNDLNTKIQMVMKDFEIFEKCTNKLDETNTTLRTLVESIDKIVALHEERIMNMIDTTKNLEARVLVLEKFKWVLLGVAAVISLAAQILHI